MRKLIILLPILILMVLPTTKVHADIICGEKSLGGFSYYINKLVDNGKSLSDLIVVEEDEEEEEDIYPAYEISESDKSILYRIVEAEVTGEGNNEYLEAKRNVASCVITRWLNGWGETIEDIVFAHKGKTYQFSPIKDGRYYKVEITEQTIEAVDWVLYYGRRHSCEYFCTKTCDSFKSGFHSTLTEVFRDCEHVYFRED